MADNNKVVFRRGEESELPTQGNIQPGAFYVVTDKKRFLYGQDENNLIEFGSVPFVFEARPPEDKRVFWIDTTPDIGGLKFYNKNTGSWDHVPVAFTSRNPANKEETGTIPEEQPDENSFIAYGTYLEEKEWIAPNDGWYKIEVFGASGNGGQAAYDAGEEEVGGDEPESGSGGGGGSGGYACSIVRLNANNIIKISPGSIGEETIVEVNSSVDNSYNHTITIMSGSNGTNAVHTAYMQPGQGGEGGKVTSNGLTENINGNSGKNGENPDGLKAIGGAGGTAVITNGTVGGVGASVSSAKPGNAGKGQKGFVIISVASS